MKIFLSNQKGFVPAILLVILTALGVTGVGTVAVSNNSVPGDPLFGVDKALEEIQVSLATNDGSKAKVHLEIARERLTELETLANTDRAVDPAVTETQLAVNNATAALSTVETKFKEDKITLESSDLQALLIQLQNLLATHQGLIRKVEVKIKDGEIKAKIKLFEQEASESADLVEDDLDDLEDDGQLNSSLVKTLKAELEGTLVKSGNLFQVTSGGVTYTLTVQTGVDFDAFVGKVVEVKGTALNSSPTQVTVTEVELEDDKDELKVGGLSKVEAKGFIRPSGSGFTLTFNGGTVLYSLTSSTINLNLYLNKFVEAEGTLSGNTLDVKEVEVKQTFSGKPVTPALFTSGSVKGKLEVKVEEKDEEDEKETPKPTNSSSNSGSGSDDSEDND